MNVEEGLLYILNILLWLALSSARIWAYREGYDLINKDVHGGKWIREGFLKYLELQLMILQFTKQVTCVTFANHTNLLR